MSTWDKDRPKGSEAANLVDDRSSANFEYLEDHLAKGMDFPGSGTGAGRPKWLRDTKANNAALGDKADGHMVLAKDLGGGSQVDGDAATTHWWPYRYSAEGGSSELAAFTPLQPPIVDDDTEQGVLEGLLETNDANLMAYRKVGSIYLPMIWNGSAFSLVGRTVVAEDEATVNTKTLSADSYDSGAEGNPFSGWDLLESSGGGDEFHLTLAVPDATGLTLRLTVGWSLTLGSGASTWIGLGVTEDIDAAGETDLFGGNIYAHTGGGDDKFNMFAGSFTQTFTNTSAVDYEYRIKARNRGNVTPSSTVITISPDNATGGDDFVADTVSHMWAKIEVVGIT